MESVQNYGALLAFEFKSLTITHASSNLDKILKINAALNKSIRDILSPDDA
ncbi:hypothetical protein [Polaribacter dokdonensis]|uniref:hypothetical protein n=1 Tax=Polaribacter dokdonensis TaxID=326329 RepID=UPI0009E70DF8